MARSNWRYIAERVSTGEILDLDLPIEDVEVEEVISGHASLSGTISPVVARMVADDGEPLLDEWGTAIYAESDGDIRAGGILVDSGFDGPDWKLDCIGFTGYLQDLPYTSAWAGVKVDPLDIVRHIWNHAQTQPNGNLNLELGDLKTPVRIGSELEEPEYDPAAGENEITLQSEAYKLAWYQDHDLASNIDKLAEETPFDYRERHAWDGETIRHFLDFGYPRLGRRRESLRFVFGENIHTSPSVERDGETYASEALILGAGEGRKMKRGTAETPTNRLRRVAVVSDPSLRTQRGVDMRARKELAWRKNLNAISQIDVRDHAHAPLGSVDVGDEILLEGRLDWLEVEQWVRVLSIAIRPEDGDSATYTVVRTDRLSS